MVEVDFVFSAPRRAYPSFSWVSTPPPPRDRTFKINKIVLIFGEIVANVSEILSSIVCDIILQNGFSKYQLQYVIKLNCASKYDDDKRRDIQSYNWKVCIEI